METEPTVDIVDGGDVNGVADNESPNNIEQTENSSQHELNMTNVAAEEADAVQASANQLKGPSQANLRQTDSPTPEDGGEGFQFVPTLGKESSQVMPVPGDRMGVELETDPVQVGIKLSRPSSSLGAAQPDSTSENTRSTEQSGSKPSTSQRKVQTPMDLPRATTPTGSHSKPHTAASKPMTSGSRRSQTPAVHFVDRPAVLEEITSTYQRIQPLTKRLDKLETFLTELYRKRANENKNNNNNNNGDNGSVGSEEKKKSESSEALASDNADEKTIDEQEQRYHSILIQFRDSLQKLQRLKEEHTQSLLQFQQTLESKKSTADETYESFVQQRHKVLVSAEYTKTGKHIPARIIEQWETIDQKRDSEISKATLDNIKLRNRLRRSETVLKEREDLGEGLHLIDFEQLKIENQTFLEKIEERNDEVEKLRKKITTMVQVLTHVKEKLEYVRSENRELSETLTTVDNEICVHKDNLPLLKLKRDKLRKENHDTKAQSGLLIHKSLLKDLEKKMDYSVEINKKLEDMKQRYPQIDYRVNQLKLRLEKMELELAECAE